MAYKKILFRRDTAANWTSANPVLSAGEIGLETDTNKIKLGDGSTAWTSLSYFYGSLDNSDLNELSDVTITSPVTWDILKYQGGVWVNAASQNVSDTANPTFASVTGDNVRIGYAGSNEIDTSSGNLTIDSAGGTVTVDDNLVVSGNLTVDGTTTTLNTETLAVEDNVITLNSNVTGSPSSNAGVEIERGTSANVQLRWNESDDIWEISTDGTNYYRIIEANKLEDRFSQELWHKPARLATTAVLPNSPSYTAGTSGADGGTGIGATLTATTYGQLTVDSVSVEAGNRVLVKNQANAVHNGIYTVTTVGGPAQYWVLTRATDMNGSYQYQTQFGETLYIANGVVNGLQTFACSSHGSLSDNVHVIGTDQITFEAISGTETVKPGNGLTASANALNVETADAGRIVVNANNIDLATVGQTNLTTGTAAVFVAGVSVDSYGRVTGQTSSSVEVTLGSQTIGNYVAELASGTGVSIVNGAGESASATISIGQAVNTDSNVTFSTVNANLTGNVTGNVLGNLTGNVTGNASTVTNGVYTTDTGSVTNTMLAGSIADSKLNTISTAGKVSNSATTADSSNTANAIVSRDANGDFSAGVVTANSIATAKTYVGTTQINLNRSSAAQGLTGITSLVMPGSTSGSVTFQPTNAAGSTTITLPATTGTVVTTGDSGTVTSTMIADGTIVNADINASAAIDKTKISGTAITAGDTGTVTSTMIADGTIVNGDINASAAIALSKLASGTTAQVVLANSSGVPTYTTLTGDVTVNFAGTTAIASGVIVNADISSTAGIALSKLAGGSSGQVLIADGAGKPAYATISGDITIDNTGVVTIANNAVALGTDTTGNYMSDVSAGTGISVTHTPGEGSTASVALNATLDDLSNVTVPSPSSGDFLKWNGSAWVNDAIDLGTDTTGSYVQSLVAGTGITLSNNSGESATPTVAIGQAVATSSSVTFAQVTTTGNVIVGGDLQVTGTTTTVNQTSLNISDPLIYLNGGSEVTDPDLGIAGNYNDGTYRHAGLFSDASDSHTFKFFKGLTVEPTAPINTAHASYAAADVSANTYISTVSTGTAPLSVSSSTVVTNLNADKLDGQDGSYYAPLNSPTLVTPNLGTPSAATLTNATGLPISTGVSGLGTGVATFLATPTSANLAAALTDETGTGANVFANSPTLVTPNLGTPSAATLTNATGLPISTGVSGLGTGVATFLATPTSANLAAALTDETGTGANVFANTPTLVTPNIGAATGTSLAATGGSVTVRAASTQDGVVVSGRAGGTGTYAVTVTPTTLTASRTLTLPDTTGTVVTTGDSGTVTSTMIADGTIVNADISSTASIDMGKIADVSTNAQTVSYTLVLGDKNKIVEMGVSSANTLTVPPNSSVAFPVGAQINVLQTGTGQTTITPGSGVTINGTPGLKTRAQWSYVTLIKRATDTWVAVGDLSA